MQMQQHQEEVRTLADELRSMIQTYLATYPHLTLQALAGRSQVAVSSLRRLMNSVGEYEIAPHSVLNLCSYILKEKNLKKLLPLLPTLTKELLQSHFGIFLFDAPEITYSPDLNQLLSEKENYLIYKLAANHQGTTWTEITELLGSMGRQRAIIMIDQNVLILDDEQHLHAKEKNFSLDVTVAAKHLPHLVGLYRPESMKRGLNLFYSLSESMTEEAIQKIKDIQREAAKKVSAIMNDKAQQGNIPYYSINLTESFFDVPTPQTGVLQ